LRGGGGGNSDEGTDSLVLIIWAGDGIHLTSNATRVVARQLVATVEGGAGADEPANKRARLESVISAAQDPPVQQARKEAPAAPTHPVAHHFGYPGSYRQLTNQEGRPVEAGRLRVGVTGEDGRERRSWA
jgi:hypothetical protein